MSVFHPVSCTIERRGLSVLRDPLLQLLRPPCPSARSQRARWTCPACLLAVRTAKLWPAENFPSTTNAHCTRRTPLSPVPLPSHPNLSAGVRRLTHASSHRRYDVPLFRYCFTVFGEAYACVHACGFRTTPRGNDLPLCIWSYVLLQHNGPGVVHTNGPSGIVRSPHCSKIDSWIFRLALYFPKA